MNTEPMTLEARKAKRRQLRRQAIEEAAVRGDYAHRSMKCRGDGIRGRAVHAGDEDGCKNDGSTCLCMCHDPQNVAVELPSNSGDRYPISPQRDG